MQSNVFCHIYKASDRIEEFVNEFSSRTPPISFCFIFHIGKQQNDNGNDLVTFGTPDSPGSHYSLGFYNVNEGRFTYCDSLGWGEPTGLRTAVTPYIQAFYDRLYCISSWEICHNPNSFSHQRGGHVCNPTACTLYCFQNDGNICGPVVIL